MTVSLERSTDLYICSDAIRECHNTKDKSDTGLCADCSNNERLDEDGICSKCGQCGVFETGEKDKALIDRVGNKMKHGSTLEHLVYTFAISGISRAVLQELARHRHASLTVKSSRYTLKELKKEQSFLSGEHNDYCDWDRVEKYIVMTSDPRVNRMSALALNNLRTLVVDGVQNDIVKYCMPESYKTSLTWTINARSLQNFINLRTHNSALWEIQQLANKVFEALPQDHKFLFENFHHIDMIVSS